MSKDKILRLALNIIEQATRKERAADDKHLLEGDLEIIKTQASELYDLLQAESPENVEFNLNDYILVQITDYGKNHILKKRDGEEFWEHVIESRKVVIDDVVYYRLQAHCVADYFGDALWCSFPAPVKPSILIPKNRETDWYKNLLMQSTQ